MHSEALVQAGLPALEEDEAGEKENPTDLWAVTTSEEKPSRYSTLFAN